VSEISSQKFLYNLLRADTDYLVKAESFS